MANLVTWSGRGGISFFVNSEEMRGYKDLSISTSADTEDSEENGQKFIKKKNAGSYQITLTALLNAALGVDVQTVALAMSEAARCGDTGYLYTGDTKLFPSSFMATDAKISDVHMNGNGVWTRCEVSWTLRQCSKYEQANDLAGSGSYYYDDDTYYGSKESVREAVAQSRTKATATKATGSSAKTTTTQTSGIDKIMDAKAKAETAKAKISTSVKNAVTTTNNAKSASSAAYSAMTGKTSGTLFSSAANVVLTKVSSVASAISNLFKK